MSSAGNTRGLIEASACSSPINREIGLPRGIPAASLKRLDVGEEAPCTLASSAGNTRGLIEALTS